MGICGSNTKREDIKRGTSDKSDSAMKYDDNLPKIQYELGGMVGENTNDIRKEYDIQGELGKGAFGSVRKAVHSRTGINRAIKSIKKSGSSEADRLKFLEEINMLKTLVGWSNSQDHPTILKVVEYFQDSANFYIVTELCEGGELFDRIVKTHHFNEKKARETMFQLLTAIAYCHDKKIVHRDLKPENILYENESDNSNLKIIDFGTSTLFSPSQYLEKRIGTVRQDDPALLHRAGGDQQEVQREVRRVVSGGHSVHHAHRDPSIQRTRRQEDHVEGAVRGVHHGHPRVQECVRHCQESDREDAHVRPRQAHQRERVHGARVVQRQYSGRQVSVG